LINAGKREGFVRRGDGIGVPKKLKDRRGGWNNPVCPETPFRVTGGEEGKEILPSEVENRGVRAKNGKKEK